MMFQINFNLTSVPVNMCGCVCVCLREKESSRIKCISSYCNGHANGHGTGATVFVVSMLICYSDDDKHIPDCEITREDDCCLPGLSARVSACVRAFLVKYPSFLVHHVAHKRQIGSTPRQEFNSEMCPKPL